MKDVSNVKILLFVEDILNILDVFICEGRIIHHL